MDISGLTPQHIELRPSSRPSSVSAPAAPSAPEVQPTRPPVEDRVEFHNEGAVQRALDSFASRQAERTRSGARIHVDKATERVVVEIVNANNEVIRQLPPEDQLRLAALFDQLTGILFDQQV